MPFEFNADIAGKHICVIGDLMLDHYIFGTCDRISPEAPVPVVDIKKESFTLGGAGNVLENLHALGCSASLISVGGNDEMYKIADKKLTGLPLAFYHLVKDNTRRTTIKTRVIASKHQLIRLDSEDKHPVNTLIEDEIIARLTAQIGRVKAIVFSDYRKGVLTDKLVKKILNVCQQHKILTIVDSKIEDLSVYYGADLIKPNKKEAILATGINIVDDGTLLQACKKIAAITGCKYVVVTLSEDGLAFYHNAQLTKMPTRSLAVFDVTGAGDTVVAALAFGLVNGLTIEKACDLANRAAAIVLGKVGSATATIEEINNIVS